MSYAFMHTPRFTGCIRDYQKRDSRYLAELWEAVDELQRNPFGNPKLQTHRMQGVPGEKRFITDVGGRNGRRLIWTLANRTIVLLVFGEHDVAERQGERLDLVTDTGTGAVEIIERTELGQSDLPRPTTSRPEVGKLFMAWSDAELADFGFGDHEVPILRRLDTEDELLELTMKPESHEVALNLVAHQNPHGATAEKRIPVEQQRDFEAQVRKHIDPATVELERQVTSPRSRKHFAPTSVQALKEIMAKPIEDWMVFLHPDQAKLTQRPYSGAARVRGAAGTGKTVVALHRAKHLAQTYGEKILLTTFVRNLPPVFESLFTRLAPELDGQVEFNHIHRWAYRFVKQYGRPFVIDTGQINGAFAEARRRADIPALQEFGDAYIREEIDWVVKGRGLATLDDYLALERTGRGTPLNATLREQVWRVYTEYERQLQRRGVIDFNDLLLRALELLTNGRGSSPYRAVVVDEAQDLTETGMRLVYELAGRDRRDGLFVVGDGQQSVYPGGFSLGQIGIDVRGRSSLLKVNYRNTRQVLNTARLVVGEHPFDDGDADPERRDLATVTVVREGDEPELRPFHDKEDHDVALTAAIEQAAGEPDVSAGDLAVLVPTNELVSHYTRLIRGLGLSCQKLQDYDGIPNEQVKVGTYQRGKGLEFKRVFLPRLDPDGLNEAPRHNEDETTHHERLELLRRQLFVAMTRARDGLWLGAVGQPSPILQAEDSRG